MNTILKYIFYFILGIIISLFLNKDLIEGYECPIGWGPKGPPAASSDDCISCESGKWARPSSTIAIESFRPEKAESDDLWQVWNFSKEVIDNHLLIFDKGDKITVTDRSPLFPNEMYNTCVFKNDGWCYDPTSKETFCPKGTDGNDCGIDGVFPVASDRWLQALDPNFDTSSNVAGYPKSSWWKGYIINEPSVIKFFLKEQTWEGLWKVRTNIALQADQVLLKSGTIVGTPQPPTEFLQEGVIYTIGTIIVSDGPEPMILTNINIPSATLEWIEDPGCSSDYPDACSTEGCIDWTECGPGLQPAGAQLYGPNNIVDRKCVPCEGENYSSDNSNCQPWTTVCQPGQKMTTVPSNTTDRTCATCEAGKYSTNINHPGECIQCEPGKYQPNTGSTECMPCEPGKYQPQSGSVECKPCEPGYYCSDGIKKTCTEGHYCPEDSTIPLECTEGKMECIKDPMDGDGGNTDFNCIGSLVKNSLGTACGECGSGKKYSESESGCEICPHGKKPNEQHTVCIPCEADEAGVFGLCGTCPSGFMGRAVAEPGVYVAIGESIYDEGGNVDERITKYSGLERLCSPSCFSKISAKEDGKLHIKEITEHDLTEDNFHVDVECESEYINFFNAQPCKNQGSLEPRVISLPSPVPSYPSPSQYPGFNLQTLTGINWEVPLYPQPLKEYILPICYEKSIFHYDNTCGEFASQDKVLMHEQCSKLNKTLLENKKCTLSQCISPDYCCSMDTPDSVEDLFNEILSTDTSNEDYQTVSEYLNGTFDYLNDKSNTDEEKTARLQKIQLNDNDNDNDNDNIIEKIKSNFGSEDLFTKNWIGSGGGQEEMASDIWKRLINRINNINGNNDLTDLTNMTDDDLKIMLINLDKPIKDEFGNFAYPTGDQGGDDAYLGLSPLDIFLYDDQQGINPAQLEALL